MIWSVYLARCADLSLYCGIARDVGARIAAHDAGAGARYTRGRGPLTVLAVRRCRDKGVALSIEHAVKRLPRAQKLALARRLTGRRFGEQRAAAGQAFGRPDLLRVVERLERGHAGRQRDPRQLR